MLVLPLVFVAGSSIAAASPVDAQRDRVEQLTSELARLERDAAVLAENHVDALAERDQLVAEITEIEGRLGEQEAAIGDLREQLAEIAVRRYTGSDGRNLGFLFNSYESNTIDMRRSVFAGAALDTGTVTTDDFEVALAELNQTQAELVDKRDRADRLAVDIEQAREANEHKQVEYEQARADAEAELGDLIREEEERRARESYEQLQRQQQAAASAAPAAAPPAGGGGGAASPPPPADPADPPAANPAPPPPTPDPAPAPPPAPPVSGRAEIAISAATSQLGVPWVFAMAEPGVGFDCSGLTSWAWGQAGVSLPHQSRSQFSSLPQIPKGEAQRGDLLFFYSPISHVSIYLGNGQQVHSPNSGDTVKVSNVNWNNVTGVGRPG